MNRWETYFENLVDRMLQGNWESRIKKISWITLLAMFLCILLIITASHIKINSIDTTGEHSIPVWKIILN